MCMKNTPGRPCESCGCPNPDTALPDWELAGFTKGAWSQYGECCYAIDFTRANLSEGIQVHNQELYKREINASVEQDWYGWWVREYWRANGPPPIGGLYTEPLPNTCWNPYGLIATIRYEDEREEKARQRVHWQITSLQVLVQRVFNSCTNEKEYYVRVNAVTRASNQTQTLSYQRRTTEVNIFDVCYEHTVPSEIGTFVTGSKTYTDAAPVWTITRNTSVLFKFTSFAAIPSTLLVDLTTSPIESIEESCFAGHVCAPSDPVYNNVCVGPASVTAPGAYEFDAALSVFVDNCLLSRINMQPVNWSVCDTLGPGLPSATGDISVTWTTCALPNQVQGFGAAISSVTACDSLTYNTLSAFGWFSIPSTPRIRRKLGACSPADAIPCSADYRWFGGAKSYYVTSDYRDLNHTKSRNVYSTGNVCLSPSTFSLVEV